MLLVLARKVNSISRLKPVSILRLAVVADEVVEIVVEIVVTVEVTEENAAVDAVEEEEEEDTNNQLKSTWMILTRSPRSS